MIYLASPYSHDVPAVMQARFDAVCRKTAELWKKGHCIFSPIAHTHPIAQYGLPLSFDYYAEFDRAMIGACDELWVLKLDGWKESRGIEAELQIAKELRVPIQYIDP